MHKARTLPFIVFIYRIFLWTLLTSKVAGETQIWSRRLKFANHGDFGRYTIEENKLILNFHL
jgi:hypothetical protein